MGFNGLLDRSSALSKRPFPRIHSLFALTLKFATHCIAADGSRDIDECLPPAIHAPDRATRRRVSADCFFVQPVDDFSQSRQSAASEHACVAVDFQLLVGARTTLKDLTRVHDLVRA